MIITIPAKYEHERIHEFRYSSKWDSIYCVTCLIWIEPKCDCDPNNGSLNDCPFNGYERLDKPIFNNKDEVAEYGEKYD